MAGAHQALRVAHRRGTALEVVALESTEHTSYSQCGIPYWVAGDVAQEHDLIARTADQHRAMGIDLRMRQEATAIDLDSRRAEVYDHAAGQLGRVDFDEVLIATGASPVIPDWARADGVLLPRVHPMKTLDDGRVWRELMAADVRRVLVVGGGYIGVEAAEAFARQGLATTLVTRREPMAATLVPEQSARVRVGLEALGVEVVGGAAIEGCEAGPGGLTITAADGRQFTGDAVVLAIGVAPRTELAIGAGLAVAGADAPHARAALVPDERQQLADGVWAAGDCCAVRDLIVRQPSYLPLGTHANKAGRVAGTNIGGGSARFPGAVGTAITRAGEVEVARAGIQPEWAGELGFDLLTASLDATTASGYMPEAEPMHVWVAADRSSMRLVAAQITGGRGAGKRIDAVATAMMAAMTCVQFAYLDLSYAPPFAATWDPVQIAVRKLAESVEGSSGSRPLTS